MTEQNASTTAVAPEHEGPGAGKAVLGPLTVRDIAALAGVLIIFIASLLPIAFGLGITGNLWNVYGLYFIGVGVILPLAVAVLFVIRRLSPEMKPRVGSLSVDQFASVVASFATAFFFLDTVTNFGIGQVVGLVGALVLLSATVLARWIPLFAADFAGRSASPAHPVARDAVPAVRRPGAPKPVLALSAGPGAGGSGGERADQADQAQPGQGRNAGTPAPVHTAAGQIFTPAGSVAAPSKTGTPDTGTRSAGAQAGVPDTATRATPVAGKSHDEATAASVQPHATGPASANVAESKAAHGAGQGAGVVPSAADEGPTTDGGAGSAPATMLNPKVIEGEVMPAGESIGATVDPQAQPATADPFWFAVDRPQNVVDERTRQFVFKLTPGSWILALEDRGSSFLVQDGHGKTGLLLDLVGIERAPEGP